ncbi:putative folate-biopterin transporter 2 [Platanthera guangdongensis]|uniref:Folate-biopterin transporter 2 n=1 Tax=Platanthera guangdongensis TaxID=2320717 RepID=A0ABR2MQX5_9ASPA
MNCGLRRGSGLREVSWWTSGPRDERQRNQLQSKDVRQTARLANIGKRARSADRQREQRQSNTLAREAIHQKLLFANQTMWKRMKCGVVWKPCLFMFSSLALSLNIQEGMFYWYTDGEPGPAFSKKDISFSYSIGSAGSLLGVLLYQNSLKSYPFHRLLFWAQISSTAIGMLDLLLLQRLNLKLGVADYPFVVISEAMTHMVGRVRRMPILVLSIRLCPPGIEGTFFALLMSIDHFGTLASSWCGGFLLQLLKISRTEFGNLWIAVLIRNLARLLPILLLNLVPRGQNDSVDQIQFGDYVTGGGDEERLVIG